MTMMIRELTVADSEAAAVLVTELGYPSSAADLAKRVRGRAGNPDLALYVASIGDAVVGLVDVGVERHIDHTAFGELRALVVSSAHRSAGVGARLVEHAERWAVARGVSKMVVRSRVQREDAHRFYRREGYAEWKRQAVFTKTLGTAPGQTASA